MDFEELDGQASKVRLSISPNGALLTNISFNAIAFYLDIADMLAKEGL